VMAIADGQRNLVGPGAADKQHRRDLVAALDDDGIDRTGIEGTDRPLISLEGTVRSGETRAGIELDLGPAQIRAVGRDDRIRLVRRAGFEAPAARGRVEPDGVAACLGNLEFDVSARLAERVAAGRAEVAAPGAVEGEFEFVASGGPKAYEFKPPG